jgi:dTDP-glucose 4,6-dehydratase
MQDELGWRSTTDFEAGIAQTVDWYLANADWCKRRNNLYAGERLGRKRA